MNGMSKDVRKRLLEKLLKRGVINIPCVDRTHKSEDASWFYWWAKPYVEAEKGLKIRTKYGNGWHTVTTRPAQGVINAIRADVAQRARS